MRWRDACAFDHKPFASAYKVVGSGPNLRGVSAFGDVTGLPCLLSSESLRIAGVVVLAIVVTAETDAAKDETDDRRPSALHDEPVKLTSLYHQRRMSRCPGVRSERAHSQSCLTPVSYTHLTLPTIYSV